MNDTLKPWLVVSPEYGEVVPVLDDGTGPMEYGCDVVHVEAETRQDALLLGVELFRKMGAHYLDDAESPYAGVKVESQICPRHGMPAWKGDHYECEECEAAAAEDPREKGDDDGREYGDPRDARDERD